MDKRALAIAVCGGADGPAVLNWSYKSWPVVPGPANVTHQFGLDSCSHDMKLLVFILIVVATSLVAADYTVYDFAGNTSSTVDPYNLLNYRYLDYSVNEAYHLGFLRSLRSEIDSDEEWAEIDTIGSLVSYNALPSTFLAFWEGEAQWSNKSFDTSDGMLQY